MVPLAATYPTSDVASLLLLLHWRQAVYWFRLNCQGIRHHGMRRHGIFSLLLQPSPVAQLYYNGYILPRNLYYYLLGSLGICAHYERIFSMLPAPTG